MGENTKKGIPEGKSTMTITLTLDQRMLKNCQEELKQARDEIHRLKHQHENDECANNKMLLAQIERLKGLAACECGFHTDRLVEVRFADGSEEETIYQGYGLFGYGDGFEATHWRPVE